MFEYLIYSFETNKLIFKHFYKEIKIYSLFYSDNIIIISELFKNIFMKKKSIKNQLKIN
jgi:hypothetical protein